MVKKGSKPLQAKKTIQKKAKPNGRAITKISAPIAVTTSRRFVDKQITQTGDLVTIHHRELLRPTFVAYDVFTVSDRIALNPGISVNSGGSPLGTWLPTIAKNYDQYRFKKLMFHFRTYASTTTPGMIIMSYDPNPENTSPSTLTDMENMRFIDSSVHTNLTFDVSGRLPKEFKFTRTGAVPTLTTYDAGFVNFASIGSNGTSVGLIEVEYIIEFKQPQSAGSTSAPLPSVPALPIQYVSGSGYAGVSDNLYASAVGTGNVFAPQALWNGSNEKLGSDLVSFYTAPTSTTTVAGQWVWPAVIDQTISSCLFKEYPDGTSYALGGVTRPCFRFNRSGRYRIDVEAAFDINIQATAAYQLFGFRRTPTTASRPGWTLPLTEIVNLDGTVATYKFPRVYVQQGVENSATAGKTAADTTQVFSFELAADVDDYYALLGGVEVSTLVATNCTITGRSTSVPPIRMIFTYLGQRLTDTLLTDV